VFSPDNEGTKRTSGNMGASEWIPTAREVAYLSFNRFGYAGMMGKNPMMEATPSGPANHEGGGRNR
jgi:hypothetical protein